MAEKNIQATGIPFWSWNDKLDPDKLVKQINEISKCKMNDNYTPLTFRLNRKYNNNQTKVKSKQIYASNIVPRTNEYHKTEYTHKENIIKIKCIQNMWKKYFHNLLIPKIIYIQRKWKFYLLSRSLTTKTLSVSSDYFEFVVNNKISKDVIMQTEPLYKLKDLECLIKNRINIINNSKVNKDNNDLCLSYKTCSVSYFGKNEVRTSFDLLSIQTGVSIITLESEWMYNKTLKNKRNKIRSKVKLKCKSFLSTSVKEMIENNFYDKNITNNNHSLSMFQNEHVHQLKKLPNFVSDNMITKLIKHKKKIQKEINIIKSIQNEIKLFLLRKSTKTKTLSTTLNELCYISKENHLNKSMHDIRNFYKEQMNNINITNKSFSYHKTNIKHQKINIHNKEHIIVPLPKEKTNQRNIKHVNNSQYTNNKDKNIKSNAYKIISNILKHHSSLKSKIFIFNSFFEYNNNYILTHPNSFISSSTIYNSNSVNITQDLHGFNNNTMNISQRKEKDNEESQTISTKQEVPIQNEDTSLNNEQIVNACQFKLQCFPSIDMSSHSESLSNNNSFIHKKRLNHSVTMDIQRITFINKKYNLFLKHLQSINIEVKDNNMFHNKMFEYLNFQGKKRQNNILNQSAPEFTYYNYPSIPHFLTNKTKNIFYIFN